MHTAPFINNGNETILFIEEIFDLKYAELSSKLCHNVKKIINSNYLKNKFHFI